MLAEELTLSLKVRVRPIIIIPTGGVPARSVSPAWVQGKITNLGGYPSPYCALILVSENNIFENPEDWYLLDQIHAIKCKCIECTMCVPNDPMGVYFAAVKRDQASQSTTR